MPRSETRVDAAGAGRLRERLQSGKFVVTAEIVPFAVNQFKISSPWRSSMRATFFSGSSRERVARRHHSTRKRAAQYGERYSQKR